MEQNNRRNQLKGWIVAGLAALLVVFVLNIVFFKVTCVPSYDMSRSVGAGDLVLINKLASPASNDLVAFYNPDDSSSGGSIFIQRCVALPGEKVKIEEGEVYVNDAKIQSVESVQFNYYIHTKKKDIDSLLRFRFGVTEGGKISDDFDFSYSLTPALADSLRRMEFVDRLQRASDRKGLRDEEIFPHSDKYSWNKYNMDGLIVPKKGATIPLDTQTICFYRKLITVYEGNTLGVSHDSIFVNGAHAKEYTVKMNYYFTLGDNRDNGIDSRYWGFLPEDRVIGKMAIVLAQANR